MKAINERIAGLREAAELVKGLPGDYRTWDCSQAITDYADAFPATPSAENRPAQDDVLKALKLARDCMTANGLDESKVPRTFHIIDAAIASQSAKEPRS